MEVLNNFPTNKKAFMEIINDFDTSVRRALTEIDPDWEKRDGLVVCGSHTPERGEETIEKIREAREADKPILGICFGLQMGVVEYARNVLGIQGANSTELDGDTPEPIVRKLPELRVGIFPITYKRRGEAFGRNSEETHWHNYAVNPAYMNRFIDTWEIYMTEKGIIELMRHRTKPMLLTQFHPEYQSSKGRPHPILEELLELCESNVG